MALGGYEPDTHTERMYVGPPIDDPDLLAELPPELAGLLSRANGYVAYHGGLHVRGACRAPAWHSLREAWRGPDAVHRRYPEVRPSDVPFAQDALGDQYLVRDGRVHRLAGETGEVADLGVDLAGFDAAARADPVGYLSLEPLEAFRAGGGALRPGELLSVYPPFVVRADDSGYSYRAVPAADRLGFLADLVAQLRGLPDGAAARVGLAP